MEVHGNYDDDYLGVNNPLHPANESEGEHEPQDLFEAFAAYKESPSEETENMFFLMVNSNEKIKRELRNACTPEMTFFLKKLNELY